MCVQSESNCPLAQHRQQRAIATLPRVPDSYSFVLNKLIIVGVHTNKTMQCTNYDCLIGVYYSFIIIVCVARTATATIRCNDYHCQLFMVSRHQCAIYLLQYFFFSGMLDWCLLGVCDDTQQHTSSYGITKLGTNDLITNQVVLILFNQTKVIQLTSFKYFVVNYLQCILKIIINTTLTSSCSRQRCQIKLLTYSHQINHHLA